MERPCRPSTPVRAERSAEGAKSKPSGVPSTSPRRGAATLRENGKVGTPRTISRQARLRRQCKMPVSPRRNAPMSHHALTALSPLDGRYASKVEALRPIFSEFGLMHRRVQVEIEWLLALAAEPKIVELLAFDTTQVATLKAIAEDFSEADGERIKAIEATTNHDVKAVEYFIKEKIGADASLAQAKEFVHFACTSEDINNLSYALMLRDARRGVLLPQLDALI